MMNGVFASTYSRRQELSKITGARTLVGRQAVRNHCSRFRISTGLQDGCLADEMLGKQFPDGSEADRARAGALAPHRDTLVRCRGCQPLREQIVCHAECFVGKFGTLGSWLNRDATMPWFCVGGQL